MSNMMILCVEIFIENIITDQIGLSFGITCQLQLRNLFNIVPVGHLVQWCTLHFSSNLARVQPSSLIYNMYLE